MRNVSDAGIGRHGKLQSMNELGVDLKSFLSSQRQEGVLDSEGGFTISADRAIEKLAFFALPEEFDWVLKVVQAVNLWKVDALVVGQTRTATSFTFRPNPQPTPASLMQALSEAALDSTDPVHALAMALRSLVEQAGLSFVLAFRQNGETGSPVYAGDDTSQLNPATRASWASLETDGIRLTVSHFKASETLTGRYIPTFSNVRPRDRDILETLQWKAYGSLSPIYVDGERLTDPARLPSVGYSPNFRVIRLGTLRGGSAESGPHFEVEDFPWNQPARELRSAGPSLPGAPWFLLRTADWPSLEHIKRQLAKPLPLIDIAPHRVVLLRQGVICKVFRLRNTSVASSLTLVVPADHYRSDLSGLGLEVGEIERETIAQLRRLVCHALEQYREVFVSVLKSPPPLQAALEGMPMGISQQAAGFSIFTESLGKAATRFFRRMSAARERHLHYSNFMNSHIWLLPRWRDFVLADLKRVIHDLNQSVLSADSRSSRR